MLTINLGPLPLPVTHLLILLGLLLAVLTGWWVGRRRARNPERQLFRLLLVALLVARLAFVLVYLEHFRDQPWRVIDIRDGGFIAWPGVLVAVLGGLWLAWRDSGLRLPLGAGLTVGLLGWGVGSLVLQAFEQGTGLPEVSLQDGQGRPVALQDYRGKPLLVNLWASWCPPCRREMPVLEEAQRNQPGVRFLFVNQGEDARTVTDFLQAQGLALENVLLDSGARLGQQVGSAALPTTLFYDAEGRQVGSHLGELSRASLARALEQLEVPTQP